MNRTFKFFVDTTFRSNSKTGAWVRLLLPIVLFSAAVALLFGAEFGKKPFTPNGEVKARPTHDQLAEKKKDAKTDPKIKIAEEPIKMKAIRSGKTSLIKNSAILTQGANWTLVPKDSILHVPEHLKSRINGERKGKKLIPWAQFYAKNRGWLQTQTVQMTQARGEKALAEESVKVYKSSARIVVAVCNKGPISVKPLKEEVAEGEDWATKSAASSRPTAPPQRRPVLR